MSAEKSNQNTFGRMEAALIAFSTLKRNRRYLDIEKINSEEETLQIKRRKPFATSKSIEAKINRSFSNSTATVTERLDKEISRFKSRFHSQQRPQTAHSFYASPDQTTKTKQLKGFSIGQQLSREQYYKVRSKPALDQRLFNNYTLKTPDQKHTYDIGRGPERDFDNSLKHINDINHDSQKIYQKYNFKSTTTDCRFHYKKQKEEGRSFFITIRPQNKAATDLSPKDVRKAAQTVRVKPKIDSFFMNSGRQLPCQFQQRSGTALTSHWREKSDKINRPIVQYSVKSLKEKLCDQRRQSISASKRPKFKKNEICDKKYFIVGRNQ